MVLKDVRPIIAELVRFKKSIPLEIDVGRYLPEIHKNTHGEATRGGIKKALRVIEQAPTIDAEPVRHGEWINPRLNKYGHPCHQCNQCLFVASQKDRHFCPDCGAKMDGGKKDG